MRTVKSLKEELNKFPDEALCFAYEGEVSGIIVEPIGTKHQCFQGVIYCGEGHREEKETECPKWE